MSAPERIWMTGEDHGASWSGSFRAFRCSSLDHSNDDGPNPDYPEYIRKDASDMAIAAARAEGMLAGLLRAAELPAYDGDGDPSGTFDHKVFVKIDAIRAAAEAKP